MSGITLHTETMDIPLEIIKQEDESDQQMPEDEMYPEVKIENHTDETSQDDNNPFVNIQLQVKQEISLTIERETDETLADKEIVNEEYDIPIEESILPISKSIPIEESILPISKSEAECDDEKCDPREESVLGDDSLVTYDYPNFEDDEEDDDGGLDSSMDSNEAAALTRVEACLHDDVNIKYEDDGHFEVRSFFNL